MVHFVIFEKWTSNYEISISILWVHTMCCDKANYFCQKCPILSFWERLVYFFASSILSKMLNFVIFWERKVYFFLTFSILSKMVHLVIFEKWTSNYEITISILCVHYVLWYIKLFLSKTPHFVILWEARVFFRFFNFVKNAQFCHFVRGPWIFFTFSILSKMLNFVIFWESRVFFRFFNFVKSAQFCHFVRGPWIFSLLHFCQKCSILSFCERPVYFFSSSILSFSERPMDFSILTFCQKCLILSFSERPVHFFQFFNFCQKWSILSFLKRGLQIMS